MGRVSAPAASATRHQSIIELTDAIGVIRYRLAVLTAYDPEEVGGRVADHLHLGERAVGREVVQSVVGDVEVAGLSARRGGAVPDLSPCPGKLKYGVVPRQTWYPSFSSSCSQLRRALLVPAMRATLMLGRLAPAGSKGAVSGPTSAASLAGRAGKQQRRHERKHPRAPSTANDAMDHTASLENCLPAESPRRFLSCPLNCRASARNRTRRRASMAPIRRPR